MRSLLSPPNLMTCARIVATPFIVRSLLIGDCYTALWLSLAAGITDGLDGFIARHWGFSTRLGAYLDPIADKILLTSLYICFGVAHLVPWWIVVLVVGRDFMILTAALGLFLTDRRDFPPTALGKLSTVVQIAASLVFLAACASPSARVDALSWPTQMAVALLTAASGVQYVVRTLTWLRLGRNPV